MPFVAVDAPESEGRFVAVDDAPMTAAGPVVTGTRAEEPIAPSVPSGLGNTAKNIGLSGGLATAGGIIGTAIAPGLGTAIGAGLGGALGDILGQETDPGYDAMQPNLGLRTGQALSTGTLSAMPLGSLAGKGAGAVVRQGVKLGAASVAAKNLETAIDEGRAASLKEDALAGGTGLLAPAVGKIVDSGLGEGAAAIAAKQAKNAVRDSTIADLRQKGFVFAPEVPEGLSVKELAKAQADRKELVKLAAMKNSPIVDAKAASAVGLDIPATAESLSTAEEQAGKAYQAVADLSPYWEERLQSWKDYRNKARDYWAEHNTSNSVAAQEKAQEFTAKAQGVQNEMDTFMAQAGKPDVYLNLLAANKRLAQINVLAQVANPITGEVNAAKLAKIWKGGRGAPLTDELLDIAKAYHVDPKQFQLGSKITATVATPAKPILAGAAGAAIGAATGHAPAGAALGYGVAKGVNAIATALKEARNEKILSPAVQRGMVPDYGTAQPDAAAAFARFVTQQTGQEEPRRRVKFKNIQRDENGKITGADVEEN